MDRLGAVNLQAFDSTRSVEIQNKSPVFTRLDRNASLILASISIIAKFTLPFIGFIAITSICCLTFFAVRAISVQIQNRFHLTNLDGKKLTTIDTNVTLKVGDNTFYGYTPDTDDGKEYTALVVDTFDTPRMSTEHIQRDYLENYKIFGLYLSQAGCRDGREYANKGVDLILGMLKVCRSDPKKMLIIARGPLAANVFNIVGIVNRLLQMERKPAVQFATDGDCTPMIRLLGDAEGPTLNLMQRLSRRIRRTALEYLEWDPKFTFKKWCESKADDNIAIKFWEKSIGAVVNNGNSDRIENKKPPYGHDVIESKWLLGISLWRTAKEHFRANKT